MSKFFGKKKKGKNGNEADRPDRNRRRMCDEGKNVSERLKKQDKEGENTEKIVYNAQKRCKIIVEKYVYIPIYNR